MRIDASTVEEYSAAGDREDDLRAIDAIITETSPGLHRPLFVGPSITMIGYGEMDWDRPSGSGVWPVIGVAAQKQYISMYVAAAKDGETLAQFYSSRLGRTNNGKSCIRFRSVSDIDTAELANAVRDAATWAEEQEETFGRGCTAPTQ
jgi:hypothetical protein